MRPFLTKLLQLIQAPDGSISESKIFTIVFKLIFTLYMCRKMPDDPWMWFTYGALVGGIELAKKYMTMRYSQPQSGASPP